MKYLNNSQFGTDTYMQQYHILMRFKDLCKQDTHSEKKEKNTYEILPSLCFSSGHCVL